jgi:hypothetical protein
MDISRCTVWQQASGDTNRDYSALCLEWGVVLNGPGDYGAWPECAAAMADVVSPRKVSDLRRFAEDVKDGDIVVLRMGTSSVLGVGRIVGGYEWHPEFGDIDGWDIQHVRRVRWLWRSDLNPVRFDTYALKLGDTTQRLGEGAVLDWLKSLDAPSDAELPPLAVLPNPSTEVSVAEVSEYLFDSGVASDSVSRLLAEMGELIRIGKWYLRGDGPSEHETVAYLVIPMLRALGWTPQRMAVEWNRVDVALFGKLPRADNTLRVVVEAKKMSNSCLMAASQAMDYARGKNSCHRLIVTDGLRYGVYVRAADESFGLHAYLNLTKLRDQYPILRCGGAKAALLAMAPEWSDEH